MNYIHGDIWDSIANRIVIPMNCVGVPGKGLALQWAQRYPDQVHVYKTACALELLRPGRIFLLSSDIILVAAKNHWRNPSQLEWIETIILRLALYSWQTGKSLAVPPIGCGNGQLDWDLVKPLMTEHFSGLPITVYEP